MIDRPKIPNAFFKSLVFRIIEMDFVLLNNAGYNNSNQLSTMICTSDKQFHTQLFVRAKGILQQ